MLARRRASGVREPRRTAHRSIASFATAWRADYAMPEALRNAVAAALSKPQVFASICRLMTFALPYRSVPRNQSRELESEPDAGDERERPARALVVDVAEAGRREVVDLRHPAHPAETQLRVYPDSRSGIDQHASVRTEGERGRLVVEVGGLADEVHARRHQRQVGLVDEPDPDRALSIRPEFAGRIAVTAEPDVQPECLIVRVLAVQVRRSDIAHRGHEISIQRLEREGCTNLRGF